MGVIDREGRLLMPRFTHALPGTTALLAMEIAKSMMEVIITDITEDILYAASEILIFGTGPECVAVTRYEGKTVGSGIPARRAAGSDPHCMTPCWPEARRFSSPELERLS